MFPNYVFLHAFREVYDSVTLYAAAGMAAIARDLGHILTLSIATMVAAIFCITAYAATTHFVSALTFICHDLFLLNK